jgi:putative glycosyltransferase (TIGR04348 family)
MIVCLVTPAPPGSRKGNRITALRWARLLRELGHRVRLTQQYRGQRSDLLVALHARRSAESVRRFRAEHPGKPLIVALTGTDLYHDIHHDPAAQASLALADRLIVLQPEGVRALPEPLRAKAVVIHQSAVAPARRPPPRDDVFEVCVLGHLRPVKDPFRAAEAARLLPTSSRVRIVQVGAALSDEMARHARAEAARNPRYVWLGELPRTAALRVLGRCRLLVLTSLMEGGANVISEALAVGTPVISSRIAGSIGLLGPDYPGYFPVGDTPALAELLHRAETDPVFYGELTAWCARLRGLADPARERQAWAELLGQLAGSAG